MKRLVELLLVTCALCTPSSVILWIFAYDLGIQRELSVNILLVSISCGFLGAVLKTIHDIIYDEN